MDWMIIHLEEFVTVDLLYKKKADNWITVLHEGYQVTSLWLYVSLCPAQHFSNDLDEYVDSGKKISLNLQLL